MLIMIITKINEICDTHFYNYILYGYSCAQNYKIENLQLGNQNWKFPCSKNIANVAMQPSITIGRVETALKMWNCGSG